MSDEIPFNRAPLVGTEAGLIEDAVERGWLAAGGHYGALCERWLEDRTGASRALLTHSCTAAMEGAALLAGIGPGDEVIMPSFTFVTTATAFAIRGATPVFVDIEAEMLNIDPGAVEAAVSPATRAIVPMHYAGVGCDIEAIQTIASDSGLTVIEDAAQGICATRNGRALGSFGSFGALSFHETKNVTCGEGGALLVNDPEIVGRADIVWQKGTNRRQFERGEIERYTWVDLGSSFGLGEVAAAFLWGQLEHADELTSRRQEIWRAYDDALRELDEEGRLRRPRVPDGCAHNAHMYYVLLPEGSDRPAFLAAVRERGVNCVFHYVPLHDSPAGERLGRASGSLANTDELSARLVRLPLWSGMSEGQVARVIDAVLEAARAL